jgi:hypothetical protein
LDFLSAEELPLFFLEPFLEPFLDDVCVVEALRDFLAYASLETTAQDAIIIKREKNIDMCFLKFISYSCFRYKYFAKLPKFACFLKLKDTKT